MNPAAPVTRILTQADALAEDAPDIDDVAPAERRGRDSAMRAPRGRGSRSPRGPTRAADQARVADVWVCAEDPGALPRQELAQLVAQRGARDRRIRP